jgi:myo-inositol-1-phosphate synthase
MSAFRVHSPDVAYSDEHITSKYTYRSTKVVGTDVYPTEEHFVLRTQRVVPKTGLMMVGWGGNNGKNHSAPLAS